MEGYTAVCPKIGMKGRSTKRYKSFHLEGEGFLEGGE
jgi:hypothetical protein